MRLLVHRSRHLAHSYLRNYMNTKKEIVRHLRNIDILEWKYIIYHLAPNDLPICKYSTSAGESIRHEVARVGDRVL